MTMTDPSPTAPPMGVVVVEGRIQGPLAARMEAELRGRIEVGTQVLVVDVAKAQFIGPSGPVSYTHLTLPTKRIV